MADPLSITAGVVGIVTAALHAANALMTDLQSITEAPDTVQALRQDISVLTVTLESLAGLTQAQWDTLGATVAEQLKLSIGSCAASCQRYQADLQRYTRHSRSDGSLSRQDHFGLVFRKPYIKAMSEQLQNCRTTLSMVISTVTLYTSNESHQQTQVSISAIKAKVDEIATWMNSTDLQLEVSELRLQQLNTRSGEGAGSFSDSIMQDDSSGLREMMEKEIQLLTLLHKLLDELKSNLQDREKTINPGKGKQEGFYHFGDHNYGVQLGNNHGAFTFNTASRS